MTDTLKITVPDDIKPDFPVMKIPSWLVMSEKTFDALFADAHSLQCHYAAFWAMSNKTCQLAIARQFFGRVDHVIEAIVNPFDCTAEGNGYFESQILRLQNQFKETYGQLFDYTEDHDFTLAPVTETGKNPSLLIGDSFDKLSTGDAPLDFLYKHPLTRKMFDQYCMTAWTRLRLMSPEENTPS